MLAPDHKIRVGQGGDVTGLYGPLVRSLTQAYLLAMKRASDALGNEATHKEALDKIITEAQAYADALERAYLSVGRTTATEVGHKVRRIIRFDPSHATVAHDIATHKRQFLQYFKRIQSDTLSQVIVRANRPKPPQPVLKRIAKASLKAILANSTGLTPYDEQLIENYRNSLAAGSASALSRILRDRRFDPSVRASISGDTPLTDEQIDKFVDGYRSRRRVYRAKTIAKTHAHTILNQSRHAAIHLAAEQANFDPDQVVRVWNAMGDNRVRDSHEDLDGISVDGMDEPWEAAGGPLLFPGDPLGPPEEIINCRCWVTYELPGEGELEDDEDEEA